MPASHAASPSTCPSPTNPPPLNTHTHTKTRPHARAGSFGRVYLGEWQSTSVAVKLLLDSGEAQCAQELSMPSPLLAKVEEVSRRGHWPMGGWKG